MFWQGGGKKRMVQMIGNRLQSNKEQVDINNLCIARNDDELLFLYYHRDELSKVIPTTQHRFSAGNH